MEKIKNVDLSFVVINTTCSIMMRCCDTGQLDYSEHTHESKTPSDDLISYIDALLEKHNHPMINQICVHKGPASYTSLRVQLSVLAGIKIANKQVSIHLPTLFDVIKHINHDVDIIAIDGGRSEVYTSCKTDMKVFSVAAFKESHPNFPAIPADGFSAISFEHDGNQKSAIFTSFETIATTYQQRHQLCKTLLDLIENNIYLNQAIEPYYPTQTLYKKVGA